MSGHFSFNSLRLGACHLLGGGAFACVLALSAAAQQETGSPVIVRPGAPGQPSKTLPSDTRATLPVVTKADVAFMQGMIHHHAQAVEMTAMIGERTQNEKVWLLGTRISHSQSDEMQFMRQWLQMRGEPTEMKMEMAAGDHSHHGGHSMSHEMLMPGMLSKKQMDALRAAKGAEFDRLFLEGMIQHHQGALTMVKELFNAKGAGQDAELFNFASDVDSGQRAEIKIMQNMLGKKPVK